MTKTSPAEGKRKYVPKPRSTPLRRGKACLNCRHLKIKCDGMRPICGQCTRVPKDEACEYVAGPSRTEQLQESVARLQARVLELEGAARAGAPSSSTSSLLFQPVQYHFEHSSGSDLTRPSSSNAGRNATGGWHGTGGHSTSGSESPGQDLQDLSPEYPEDIGISMAGNQDPPFLMMQALLDTFTPHALIFNFFLNIPRFLQSAYAAAAAPPPSSALLNAVYLWGSHLSISESPTTSSDQSIDVAQYEPVFLNRTLRCVATEVVSSGPLNRNQLLHTIQAEVLLATYFFRNNQFLEAEFHLNGAVSLVFACQLHKSHPTSFPMSMQTTSDMGSGDAISEGERINAFWTVLCLQRQIMLSLHAKTSNTFGTLEAPAREIDTPWPLDMEGYEAGHRSLAQGNGTGTMNVFFQNPVLISPREFAGQETYVKANLLYHQAVYLGQRWKEDMTTDQFSMFSTTCTGLIQLITQFQSTLSPVSLPPSPQVFTQQLQSPPSVVNYPGLPDPWSMTMSVPQLSATDSAWSSPHNSNSSWSSPHNSASTSPSPQDSSAQSQISLLTHALTTSATMRVLLPFPFNRHKVLSSARLVLELLGEMINVPGCTYVNPMVGTLCYGAAEVCLRVLQSVRTDPGVGVGDAAEVEQEVMGLVNGAVASLTVLSSGNPFIGYQLSKVQNLVSGVHS